MEDELSSASKEEVGENMGHIMEVKEILSWLGKKFEMEVLMITFFIYLCLMVKELSVEL